MGQYLAVSGCAVHYEILGPENAPWIVLCHGAGLDAASFRTVALQLAKRFRVLLWDLPGHGFSQPMPPSFSAGLCADALKTLFDTAGIERAVLVGFSFGGVMAQIFAKRHPPLVHGFIAYGCFSPHLLKPLLPRALVGPAVFTRFGLLPWAVIRRQFARLCCRERAARALVEQAMRPLGKRAFLRAAAANLAARDYDPDFRISGPVLLIAGAEDANGTAIWQTMSAFERAYPFASQITIPNAGHAAHLDQPLLFAQALEDFLRWTT
jgi:pimeloyl-ACP methyl ester carboxylesterase